MLSAASPRRVLRFTYFRTKAISALLDCLRSQSKQQQFSSTFSLYNMTTPAISSCSCPFVFVSVGLRPCLSLYLPRFVCNSLCLLLSLALCGFDAFRYLFLYVIVSIQRYPYVCIYTYKCQCIFLPTHVYICINVHAKAYVYKRNFMWIYAWRSALGMSGSMHSDLGCLQVPFSPKRMTRRFHFVSLLLFVCLFVCMLRWEREACRFSVVALQVEGC